MEELNEANERINKLQTKMSGLFMFPWKPFPVFIASEENRNW